MHADEHQHNWERFRHAAALRFHDGRRLLIPVLGAGSRRWITQPAQDDALVSWEHLIGNMARACGVDDRVVERGSLTAAFEHVVHRVHATSPRKRRVSTTEQRVIATQVVAPLQSAVAAARTRASVVARTHRFLEGRYADRIDLCFDGLLYGHGATTHPGNASVVQPSTTCVIDGMLRAWHPHGYVGSPHDKTDKRYLVLGHQRYGRAVAGAVRAFERHMQNTPNGEHRGNVRDPAGDVTVPTLNAWRSADADNVVPSHWLPVALHAPLILLGVGLGPEEWDLNWFLQMRARVHARMPAAARPPTFRLTIPRDRTSPEVARRAMPGTDLLDLHVDGTWDQAWDQYFQALDAAPPVSNPSSSEFA